MSINSRKTSRITFSGLALGTLSLVACAVGPDYEEPVIDKPTAFVAPDGSQSTTPADEEALAVWWLSFEDPILRELIEEATRSGLDAAIAAERINEARAILGQAGAQLYPTISTKLGFTRGDRFDGSTGFNAGSASPSGNLHTSGLDVLWEVDLFGRIRRLQESEAANTQALIEEYRSVLVSLHAEVALAYTEYRTMQERIRIAGRNIDLQRQAVNLTSARSDAGVDSALDTAQAQSNLAITEATVPDMFAALGVAKNRLGFLIGGYPDAASTILKEEGAIPSTSEMVSIGIPLEVIRRRPDIRAAERRLASASAEIGVATAELYPRLSLFGTLSVTSITAHRLFSSESGVARYGPNLTYNIFQGWSARHGIKAAESRFRQAYLEYESIIKESVREVEDALLNVDATTKQLVKLTEALEAARIAEALADAQYREGIVGFQVVLDAQRVLASVELNLAEAQGERATRTIVLFKSLGGGWQGVDRDENPDR